MTYYLVNKAQKCLSGIWTCKLDVKDLHLLWHKPHYPGGTQTNKQRSDFSLHGPIHRSMFPESTWSWCIFEQVSLPEKCSTSVSLRSISASHTAISSLCLSKSSRWQTKCCCAHTQTERASFCLTVCTLMLFLAETETDRETHQNSNKDVKAADRERKWHKQNRHCKAHSKGGHMQCSPA